MVAAVVVELPFWPHPVALPVAMRLARGGPEKTILARALMADPSGPVQAAA